MTVRSLWLKTSNICLCKYNVNTMSKSIWHNMMQAEFLINTEDTVFSFTTYAPLTFHKGDFQVSKECAFDEQWYCQPRWGNSKPSNLEQQKRKKYVHFKVVVSQNLNELPAFVSSKINSKCTNDAHKCCPGRQLTISLGQGSSNLSLEGQSVAEFSSNPDQTHLPVIF